MSFNIFQKLPPPNSSVSWLTVINPEAKYKVRAATILLFNNPHEDYLIESYIFRRCITTQNFRNIYLISPVSLPPQNFVQPSGW